MDLQQHLEQLKTLVGDKAKELTLAVRVPAANKLLADTKNRITNEGKASDGSKIGSYSTRPAYYSKNQFVKKGAFKPQGKAGRNKNAKSMYLQQGYKQFKEVQGRQSQFINSELSGDTMLAYQSQVQGNADILQGLTTQKAAKIRQGNEKRFKPYFKSTKEEIDAYNKECAEGYAKITIETLKG